VDLDADPGLSVGVLAGAGYLLHGMNLRASLAGGRPTLLEAGFAGFVERPPAKLLIAAVEGAVANGFELVSCLRPGCGGGERVVRAA
jgi:enoyl-CoA hydratase